MPIDLDELERLEREATQGPWCVESITHHSDCGQHSIEWYRLYEVYEDDPPLAALGAHPDAGHDAKLIAALRNAAPALFAELRAARKRIAELEKRTNSD